MRCSRIRGHDVPISAYDRLAAACERIAQTEAGVRAWAHLDEPHARILASQIPPGAPLAGTIVGVKDIFDVAGMPTRCGIAGDDLARGDDAAAVARLRAAGAVVLGKTRTTPFAWLDPAETRNPHDFERTPGGSSAGSAAAVAAGHCTVALGSQTVASTLRPASFCGVVGFKPTFDRIVRAGMTPLAPSLDHVGIFARTIAEIRDAAGVLVNASVADASARARTSFLVDDLAGDTTAEPDTRAALAMAVAALRASGCTVDAGGLPPAVRRGGELIMTLLAYESFAIHGRRWRDLGAALPPRLSELLQLGSTTARGAYESALAEREALRPAIAHLFGGERVVLTLCAPGEAPDRSTTGDGRYVRPWTFFGVPAIALPVRRGARGLPIGVQLVAPLQGDAELLATAARLEAALAETARS